MTIPTTYADWVILLERFGNGDDTVLNEISTGNFTLDVGTAQRFCSRVEEAYKKRKQDWLNKFQRSFQMENVRTNGDLEIIIHNGKQNLIPLSGFVRAKGFPEDLQNTLLCDLTDFILEIRKSLHDSFSRHAEKEKMLVLLKTFALPDVPKASRAEIKMKDNEAAPVKRKIIF